jgi:predicted transcriptional regulator
MAVDRLSVTVPSELGVALRALAAARRATVSTVIADAVAHQVRLAALDLALEEADRRFGPVDEQRVAEAEAELIEAARVARRGRQRARSPHTENQAGVHREPKPRPAAPGRKRVRSARK